MRNIFVGNLDLETSAESIRSLFEPIGTVRKLKLMLDRNTGLSRGFAFIEMIGPEADKAVAALDGRVLDGPAIDVHEGRPKLHDSHRRSTLFGEVRPRTVRSAGAFIEPFG